MSRVIESIVMPGGWHKPEKDRLGRDLSSPIRADTYQQLIQAVIKFRADNIIPIGDVESEIEAFICANFPHMCHAIPGAQVTVTITGLPTAHAKSLTDDMLQWLDSKIENHSLESLELRGEAQRRAEICLHCPFNVRWNSGCGACSEATNRMSMILRAGNDVPHGNKLTACQILRHENRAAVWMRREILGNSPELPGNCWVRR